MQLTKANHVRLCSKCCYMYKLNDRTPHTRNIDVHAYVSAASRIFSSRSGLAARSASVTVRTLAGNTKLYTTCTCTYMCVHVV